MRAMEAKLHTNSPGNTTHRRLSSAGRGPMTFMQQQQLTIAHNRMLDLENELENSRMKNIELEEKVEELSAMVEVLRMEGVRRTSPTASSRPALSPGDRRAGGLGVC